MLRIKKGAATEGRPYKQLADVTYAGFFSCFGFVVISHESPQQQHSVLDEVPSDPFFISQESPEQQQQPFAVASFCSVPFISHEPPLQQHSDAEWFFVPSFASASLLQQHEGITQHDVVFFFTSWAAAVAKIAATSTKAAVR